MEQKQETTQNTLAVSKAPADAQVTEIDLVELFFVLLHSWKALLLASLIGAVIMAAFHTFFVHPTYRATTQIYITSSDSVISLQDLQIGMALTSDYQSIIKSRSVLNKVIDELDLGINYKRLGSLVSVSNPTGTRIIETSVTTSDLALSRDIANALLTVSIDSIYQIVGSSEPTVIDYSEAEAVEDVSPRLLKYVVIGALVGFLLVAAFVSMRMIMDNTIKTDDDVQKYLQLPVLAGVPLVRD